MVWMFVGTRDDSENSGFVSAHFDTSKGGFSNIHHYQTATRPTWIETFDSGEVLFLTSSEGQGKNSRIVSARFDRETGRVSKLSAAPSGGVDPTYIGHNDEDGVIYVANFRDGRVATISYDDDFYLSEPHDIHTQVGCGPCARQDSAHPHAASLSPGRRFVLSPDLGADRVFVYRTDRFKNSLVPELDRTWVAPAGTGPRHLAFHPTLDICYIVLELTADIEITRWDEEKGELTSIERVSMLSEGYDGRVSASEISCSSDGRFFYATNRGEHQVIVYAIDQTSGSLQEIQREASGGLVPWHFRITPCSGWLMIAHFKSDNVTVFKRDPVNGCLVRYPEELSVVQAVNVAFLDRT